MNKIEIYGRRWFQRSYGNTYHTAVVVVDGQEVIRTSPAYGYDDHYQQTAYEELIRAGLLPAQQRYASGGCESLRTYCARNGIDFSARALDVAREKDLHRNGSPL